MNAGEFVDLLREVEAKLTTDAGMVASVEFPGCITVARTDGRVWVFGTANPPRWGWNITSADGAEVYESGELDVHSECSDAGAIAWAITKTVYDLRPVPGGWQ